MVVVVHTHPYTIMMFHFSQVIASSEVLAWFSTWLMDSPIKR